MQLKLFTCLVLSFLPLACGQNGVYDTDVKIQPILSLFESRYGQSPIGVKFVFVPSHSMDDPKYLAECNGGVTSTIRIDELWWDNEWTSPQQKIAVLFHELGHCMFHRNHRADLYADGCPVSFMYPTVVSVSCYWAHTDEYFKELPQQQ